MFKKIILFLLISNLFSADLVDIYRKKGINEVKNKIEQLLKTKSYWSSFLKNKDVSLGYYETEKFIIHTQKNNQKLSLYKKQNGSFKLLYSSKVISGENAGDKYKEGDKKTPVGAYDLVEKKVKVDQFYGPFALVTSYPNAFDKSLKKKGHGIWIHGMPLYNKSRELFTQGCIALDNNKLKTLDRKIDLNKTVLLTSQNRLKKAKKEEIALILAFIFQWKEAWKKSDIKKYLSFYSNEFKKKNGIQIGYFRVYKTKIFNRKEKKIINLDNINIYPYPNSLGKNMFKVDMREEYKSPAIEFNGQKELYLEIVNNKVRILSED